MKKLRLWNQNNLFWHLHCCVPEGGKFGTGLALGFWNDREVHAQQQKVQDALTEKLSATKFESGNVEVQWNNIKKCVLHTMRDLVAEVSRKAREPWITQELISKMDEQRDWDSVNN
jgi:hypothetical protein